jgi:hypothetical protein
MTVPERLASRDLDVVAVLPASSPPAAARIVIVGGGIIGSSIAYHLALAGSATSCSSSAVDRRTARGGTRRVSCLRSGAPTP